MVSVFCVVVLSAIETGNRFALYFGAASALLLCLVFCLAFFQNRAYVRRRLAAMAALKEAADKLEDCSIGNLPGLIACAAENGDADLERQLRNCASESERLYQGKWLPELRGRFNYRSLLPYTKRRRLRSELVTGLLLLSLLSALVYFLIPFFNELDISLLYPGGTFALGLLLSLLLYFNNRSLQQRLNDLIDELCASLTRVLPEFSSLSGNALLIDEFMRYDRRMTRATEQLSDKVRDLSDQRLIETVSESIERVLERQVAPSLAESNAALARLCTELSERQDKGMEDLSARFSASLADTVAAAMKPMEAQVAAYSEQVAGAKDGMQLALAQYEDYRRQAGELDRRVTGHLEALEAQSRLWNQGLEGLRRVSADIAANNATMTELQSGSEAHLAGKIQLMAEAIENYGRLNEETLRHLRDENALLNKLLADTQAESGKVLAEYRHLTQRITISAMDIEKHNGEISANLEKLSVSLEDSVKHFSEQIKNGVDLTLGDFDNGLAELTERLSHSATAIRDGVARLVEAVQSGEPR